MTSQQHDSVIRLVARLTGWTIRGSNPGRYKKFFFFP